MEDLLLDKLPDELQDIILSKIDFEDMPVPPYDAITDFYAQSEWGEDILIDLENKFGVETDKFKEEVVLDFMKVSLFALLPSFNNSYKYFFK